MQARYLPWFQVVALVAGLWISPGSQAQSHEVVCPEPKAIPEFTGAALRYFEQLTPHRERWREPLQWHRLLRELDRLRIDGLNPQNYFLAELARISERLAPDIEPADCEATLASLAFLQSLSDLRHGRLDPMELGLMWHHRPDRPDPESLALAAHRGFHDRKGLRQAYQDARPEIPQYRLLRAAYRELRREMPTQWPTVALGNTLRPGDPFDSSSSLGERLLAQGYLTPEQWPVTEAEPEREQLELPAPKPREGLYQGHLVAAVRQFQSDHGLEADGIIGRHTLATLNLPPAIWEAKVRANLERLRWIAPYLSDDQVLVDIAGATITYLRDGTIAWQGNTQVGRPERKTPALTSHISHLSVNPTWTIPPTVFYEDTLPEILKDSHYLTRNRLTVLDRNGNPLSPDEVDWSRPQNVQIRQAAGPDNALGEVAIRFPNPYAVYLHDTPSRWLFQTPSRFYSSGCVRVENAMALSNELFRESGEDRQDQLARARKDGETRNVSLPSQVSLIMAYWTAEADHNGRLRFREDPYEEDRLIIDVLEEAGT